MTVAVAVAVVVGLAPGTTQDAFAGWTAIPTPANPAAVAAARAVCGNVAAGSVVAAETRGPFTALAYTKGSGSNSTPWQCVVKGKERLLDVSAPFPSSVVIKPKAGQVSLPTVSHVVHGAAVKRLNQLTTEQESGSGLSAGEVIKPRHGRVYTVDANSPTARRSDVRRNQLALEVFAVQTGPDSLSAASGWVGAGVRGVTFVLRDGTDVTATVGNGWYFAWWPGSSTANATLPKTILITTASGTRSAPYSASYLLGYFSPCLLGKTCVGGRGWRISNPFKPGVSSLLVKRFRLFRDVPATSTNDLRGTQRHAVTWPGVSTMWGIDFSQARKVDFGRSGTVWVMPGTERVCISEMAPAWQRENGSGFGTCNDLNSVLSEGLEGGGGYLAASGAAALRARRAPAYYIACGLVPDGDVTAAIVRLPSGRAFTIPIKDNTYLGLFRVPNIGLAQSLSVKFKHADGEITGLP